MWIHDIPIKRFIFAVCVSVLTLASAGWISEIVVLLWSAPALAVVGLVVVGWRAQIDRMPLVLSSRSVRSEARL